MVLAAAIMFAVLYFFGWSEFRQYFFAIVIAIYSPGPLIADWSHNVNDGFLGNNDSCGTMSHDAHLG